MFEKLYKALDRRYRREEQVIYRLEIVRDGQRYRYRQWKSDGPSDAMSLGSEMDRAVREAFKRHSRIFHWMYDDPAPSSPEAGENLKPLSTTEFAIPLADVPDDWPFKEGSR
jgi:hypothetical protein